MKLEVEYSKYSTGAKDWNDRGTMFCVVAMACSTIVMGFKCINEIKIINSIELRGCDYGNQRKKNKNKFCLVSIMTNK